jgi:hypothetical protein
MHRFVAGLLCAFLALAVSAAPAPLSSPWVAGWDRPIDPRRDCRFDRAGDRLTITVPGWRHDLDLAARRLTAPRLLRDVAGDFVVQVRMGSGPSLPAENAVYRAGGLVVTDGKQFVRLLRTAARFGGEVMPPLCRVFPDDNTNQLWLYDDGPPLREAAYLRIERRGGSLSFFSSRTGEAWQKLPGPFLSLPRPKLPHKLKVGVIGEATARGEFKVVFDRFKLFGPSRQRAPAGAREPIHRP